MNNEQKLPNATRMLQSLDHAGFRHTRPRQALIERIACLGEKGINFTAADLWQEVRQTYPGLGRITTFRIVEVLVKLGLIDRMVFPDSSVRYHVVHDVHQYITCENCHKVIELDPGLAPPLFDFIARQYGFTARGHRVEIVGRCPDCQKESEGDDE